MPDFLHHLPFSPHIRPLHALTYLLAVPFSSIALLVFLNSSLSFLLTNLFHTPPSRLGSVVGTLGFVDELVALFAAPLWGWLSDGRIGTKGVTVAGYTAIAVSLVLFVEVPKVYPGLVGARVVFSVGAAAVTTMVSAMLPTMAGTAEVGNTPRAPREGKLAGLVGLSTGLGAVAALGLLLPLPTALEKTGRWDAAGGVRAAYVITAVLSALVGVWCALGLPKEEREKRETWTMVKTWIWTRIWGGDPGMLVVREGEEGVETGREVEARAEGVRGLVGAVKVGWRDGRIGVAYVGGFVARAASVGISLFMPLWVNYYYVNNGQCAMGEGKGCRRAYILAATLTGTSQLTALLLAPVFGYLTDRASATPHFRNLPILSSSLLGIIGFTLFPTLSPEHPAAFIFAALTGASQIGAIVSSLGLLTQGITSSSDDHVDSSPSPSASQPLLPKTHRRRGRETFKGSIAGVYSLSGAAAILLLTKAGGKAFDKRVQAPFWMMAGFNGVLLVVGAGEMVYRWWSSRR